MSLNGLIQSAKDAVQKVADAVTVAVVSTEFMQAYTTVPALRLKIETDLLPDFLKIESDVMGVEGLNYAPQLKSVLMSLFKCSKDIITELSSDEHLVPIAKILGAHMSEYTSQYQTLEQAKLAAWQGPTIQELTQLAYSLVSVENYLQLQTDFKALNTFAELKPEEKAALIERIKDGKLVNSIMEENANLEVQIIKAQVKEKISTGSLSTEFKVTDAEKAEIIAMFDKIVDKHLETFNQFRKQLVPLLPSYLNSELIRVSPQPQPITPSLNTVQPALGKKKGGKRKAEEIDSSTTSEADQHADKKVTLTIS